MAVIDIWWISDVRRGCGDTWKLLSLRWNWLDVRSAV